MHGLTFLASAWLILNWVSLAHAQKLTSNIRYINSGHERHVLDVYQPEGAKNLPVVFWIHGGGWQAGDKTDVQIKPSVFCERGFVFVSTNYRLLPNVEMKELIQDVAKAMKWVHQNISNYGGDHQRVFVMGHSAGANSPPYSVSMIGILPPKVSPSQRSKGASPSMAIPSISPQSS